MVTFPLLGLLFVLLFFVNLACIVYSGRESTRLYFRFVVMLPILALLFSLPRLFFEDEHVLGSAAWLLWGVCGVWTGLKLREWNPPALRMVLARVRTQNVKK